MANTLQDKRLRHFVVIKLKSGVCVCVYLCTCVNACACLCVHVCSMCTYARVCHHSRNMQNYGKNWCPDMTRMQSFHWTRNRTYVQPARALFAILKISLQAACIQLVKDYRSSLKRRTRNHGHSVQPGSVVDVTGDDSDTGTALMNQYNSEKRIDGKRSRSQGQPTLRACPLSREPRN